MPATHTSCLNCNKEFECISYENRKYCTKSCASQLNNRLAPKRSKIERICEKCNVCFIPDWDQIKYCKICHFNNKIKNKTIKELKTLDDRKWKYKINSNCATVNNKLKKIFSCQICKTNSSLELAHIIQVSDADENMKVSEINDQDNILILCSKHHGLFDRQKILLIDIPFREGQSTRTNRDDLEKKFKEKSIANTKEKRSIARRTNVLGDITHTCIQCNKLFSPDRKQLKKLSKGLRTFCSASCFLEVRNNRSIYENRTISYYTSLPSIKKLHKSSEFCHIRLFARSWHKHLLTQPCKNCNETNSIELAHIKPIASFPPDTKLSVVNNPDNLLNLCSNCHKAMDSGKLTLDQINNNSKSNIKSNTESNTDITKTP